MINWFCHMYPYGNLHELNLDWVIDTVKRGEHDIANFIGVNTIKYANPILWNIESQYEANTVVVDGQTGNAYISVKPVPSGVHLSRTEYWTQIYNYGNVVDTLREQIAYNEGESTTATSDYGVNDLVFVNGELYRVIHNMIAGDSFIVDSNVVKTTINDELGRLREDIDDEATARANADTQLQTNIDNEATARANADSQLQTNIDNEATARANADTQLQNNINAEITERGNADDYIKSFLPLNNKIIIVGDSYTQGVGATIQTGLGYTIAKHCNKTIGVDAFIMGQSACGFVASGQLPSFETIMVNNENLIDNPNSVSCVIIVGGTNDALRGVDISTLGSAVTSIKDYIRGRYPNAHIMLSSNIVCAGSSMAQVVNGYLDVFKRIEYVSYIGDLGNFLKKLYINLRTTMSERIHPNSIGYDLAGKQVSEWIKGHYSDMESINISMVSNIDGRLNTNGNKFTFNTLATTIFNSTNFNFNSITRTQLNNLVIGKTKSAFPIANVWEAIPYLTGEEFGLIETTYESTRAFYPCIFRFNLDADGYVNVIATATIDDQFLWADSINAFWVNMRFSGDLCYAQLNI